jgi:hypothetical protein
MPPIVVNDELPLFPVQAKLAVSRMMPVGGDALPMSNNVQSKRAARSAR